MRSFDISLQKTLKTQKYCRGFLNASGDVVYEKKKKKCFCCTKMVEDK